MKAIVVYIFIGWNLAPVLKFIDKYIFNDWEFLKFLVVICAVDTALGMAKAIKAREFSSKGFEMVFKKIIVYTCALVVTHVMVHFTINNKVYPVFSWLDYVIFSAILVREAISIFENIALIDPSAFPKKILKYLKQFDSMTGEYRMKQPEIHYEDDKK